MNKKSIKTFLKKHNITQYLLCDDLTVDVYQNVNLGGLKEKQLPIKFGIIKGNFIISFSQLNNLIGCPNEIYGNFQCEKSRLKSLKGISKIVHGNVNCMGNYLKELDDIPDLISGYFDLTENPLECLDINKLPTYVKKDLLFSYSSPINNLEQFFEKTIDIYGSELYTAKISLDDIKFTLNKLILKEKLQENLNIGISVKKIKV